MQHFYKKLRKTKDGQTAYQRFLAQLTKASPAQMKGLDWNDW